MSKPKTATEKLRARKRAAFARKREQRSIDAKVEALRTVAAALDQNGDSPERMKLFETLCAELAGPLVGRFSLRSHEHRQNVFGRMRRLPDKAMFGQPYASWSELVERCLRSEPVSATVPRTQERMPKAQSHDDVVEARLRAHDFHNTPYRNRPA
jgi:hypothetical protein